MKFKTKLLAFVAMLALILGLAAPGSPVAAAAPRPAVTSTTYTDCGQSAFLGARVCLDKTTVYGPVVFIYSNGTTLYASFAVGVAGVASPSSFVATPLEYVVGSINNYPSGNVALALYALPGITNQIVTQGDQNAKNLLDWFANDANYEFVVTN